jgi:hypothetical protein
VSDTRDKRVNVFRAIGSVASSRSDDGRREHIGIDSEGIVIYLEDAPNWHTRVEEGLLPQSLLGLPAMFNQMSRVASAVLS